MGKPCKLIANDDGGPQAEYWKVEWKENCIFFGGIVIIILTIITSQLKLDLFSVVQSYF